MCLRIAVRCWPGSPIRRCGIARHRSQWMARETATASVRAGVGAGEGRGQDVPRIALGVAAWLRFLQGRADDGTALSVDDPKAETLTRAARAAGNSRALCEAILAMRDVVPSALAEVAVFRNEVMAALDRLPRMASARRWPRCCNDRRITMEEADMVCIRHRLAGTVLCWGYWRVCRRWRRSRRRRVPARGSTRSARQGRCALPCWPTHRGWWRTPPGVNNGPGRRGCWPRITPSCLV